MLDNLYGVEIYIIAPIVAIAFLLVTVYIKLYIVIPEMNTVKKVNTLSANADVPNIFNNISRKNIF